MNVVLALNPLKLIYLHSDNETKIPFRGNSRFEFITKTLFRIGISVVPHKHSAPFD